MWVDNLALLAVLDVLTLLAVSAPVWTALLWGRERRGWLLALIVLVQAPVAVLGFAPVADPLLHVVAVVTSLTLTSFSLWYVRRDVPIVVAPPARR